jgi:hypothetical protein
MNLSGNVIFLIIILCMLAVGIFLDSRVTDEEREAEQTRLYLENDIGEYGFKTLVEASKRHPDTKDLINKINEMHSIMKKLEYGACK